MNALTQMIDRNCTRIKFSERFKGIIDSYNAGALKTKSIMSNL